MAAITLPRILKNLNLFIDGVGHAGHIDEVTPPKLTLKMEEHRAGGMDTPVELDMGTEKLEMSFVLSDHSAEVYNVFGLLNNTGTPFVIRGALQRQADATVTPIAITAKGSLKEIDGGTWKPGDKNVVTIMATLTYYKLEIDGQPSIEIDTENMIRAINGEDQLAEQRAAIGI